MVILCRNSAPKRRIAPSHEPPSGQRPAMKVPSFSTTIMQILAAGVVCLTLVSLAGQYYMHFLGDDTFWLRVAKKLDVNQEDNLSTWYQTVGLLSGFPAARRYRRSCEGRRRPLYASLGDIGARLSLSAADAFLVIHSGWTYCAGGSQHAARFTTRGHFLGIFVLVCTLAYLIALFHLPERTRAFLSPSGCRSRRGNSVSGGLSGGGNEREVMKPLGKQLTWDPSFERKRQHTMCGISAGVSGLSIPRGAQGAVHIDDLGIAETEREDRVNTTTVKVRVERLSIERVAVGQEGEVAIGGAGTQIG